MTTKGCNLGTRFGGKASVNCILTPSIADAFAIQPAKWAHPNKFSCVSMTVSQISSRYIQAKQLE
jgi:hypothetical protein